MNAAKKSVVIDFSPQTSVDAVTWERLSGESPRWFSRFNAFRLLGGGRSIDSAWRQEQGTKTNKNGRAPDSWHKAARRYNWRERALVWDVADAERVGQEVLDERIRRLKQALRHRRRREKYLEGLETNLRSYGECTLNKLNPVEYARFIEWHEARMQAHFSFVQRMMRLGQAEYAAEERLLASVAIHQQKLSSGAESKGKDTKIGRETMIELTGSAQTLFEDNLPLSKDGFDPGHVPSSPITVQERRHALPNQIDHS